MDRRTISTDTASAPGQLHLAYRPDIDGLRAVAVLLVVGFHAFPQAVMGGFVGVDIFFVISGFLISSIIFAELHNGQFNMADFYRRRVRRIFPALIVVLLACMLFGWWALFADEYKSMATHVIAGAGFVSNLLLWRQSGYFDPAADTKPLLHLWSLGIEEQFYIVWPVVCLFLWRQRRHAVRWLGALLVASFLLNVALLAANPVEVFYWPVTRFWELLAGGLLALVVAARPGVANTQVPRNAMALAGLALVALAASLIDKARPFPGWWALLPVLGSCLLIGAGPGAWINRRILSNRVMVWFGLISFPLYLWHWPLLSFARIVQHGDPPLGMRLILVVASILLAWLTYRLVELPVRSAASARRLVWPLGGLLLSVVVVAAVIRFQDGVPSRDVGGVQAKVFDLTRDMDVTAYPVCDATARAQMPTLDVCVVSSDRGPPSMAVLGDSHAYRLFIGVAALDKGRNWLLLETNAGPPLSGVEMFNSDGTSLTRSTADAVRHLNRQDSVTTVVLAFFGTEYLSAPDGRLSSRLFAATDTASLFAAGLDRTVTELEARGKRVIVLLDNPRLPFDPRDCLPRPLGLKAAKNCALPREDAVKEQGQLRRIVEQLAKAHPALRVYDSLDALCTRDSCAVEDAQSLFYTDSHHLSRKGSDRVATDFLRWFNAPKN